MWKYGGCRIDFIPKLASAGESKSVKNSVAQTYAQKVLDNCGDASDGGSAIGVSSRLLQESPSHPC